MSLYNLVLGYNPLANLILLMLGVTVDEIPRFRDAFYNGEYLCIHTRTGGGNREYYDEPNDENITGPYNSYLRTLPGFVRDEDGEFDNTYATFYFKVPEQFAWFPKWAEDKVAAPPHERWLQAIEHLKTAKLDDPAVKRVTEALGPLVNEIKGNLPSH